METINPTEEVKTRVDTKDIEIERGCITSNALQPKTIEQYIRDGISIVLTPRSGSPGYMNIELHIPK